MNEAGHEADQTDMAQLASGHDAALDSLMQRHGPKLFNYLVRCLQNEDDAADAAQETFVRVYQSRTRFDARQKFSTWLYAIATNLVKDRYRYRTRHPQVSMNDENSETGGELQETLPAQQTLPDEELEKTERAATIRNAVANLPDELRVPLILFEYENLSQGEISKILKCSAKAVESRIYRARQTLRAKLSSLLLLS